ncbi:hypothetical protein DFJ43DRAFT_1127309 [Lentinula guzmanii]|uniref:Vacuolar sorting protein 39/Transforming growth factor beta receptor-associated domain-containing protein n=1 Tax=Lentinula guzmanii TaxID=2804957 RepID=A0AA38J2X2_9AGAR|nr:hypothetical protein DFJ43DRAFT_1127309 [Lentinula guzmanii]
MSRSLLLLLGRHSVQSLVPATLISQIESLLENHKIQHAADLADQERRRQLYGGVNVDEAEAEQLQYIYQRIGFQCFGETLFEDAGKHLFEGGLDPRVLVSYYPHLRGALNTADDTINMFAGVAEHMPPESSVEDIIAANLVRNYSPHLSPNTREAPSTSELRKILLIAAEDMLEDFLRKCRTRRVLEGQGEGGQIISSNREDEYAAVDTVLVKLFARSEKTRDLYALLHEPHHIVVPEVEPVLIENGQYNALCELFQQAGDHENLLDVWSKLITGEWSDEDVSDPVVTMVTYLTNLNERPDKSSAFAQITQKWALWLMHEKRAPEQGLKLLISSRSAPTRVSGKRSTRHQSNKNIPNPDLDAQSEAEDQNLLLRIREVNPTVALQYLEYLILQRRNQSRGIHMEYAMACIDELIGYLQNDEGIEKLWRAKASSYFSSSLSSSSPVSASAASTSTSTPLPFISYFASTTPDSPSKRARLKNLLFLQASGLYDVNAVKHRILSALKGQEAIKGKHKPLLSFELAILESKLGNHRAVLECLVRDVGDGVSAEAYCAVNNGAGSNGGRQVISTRVCRIIADTTEGLHGWKDVVIATAETEISNEALVQMLLEVYMSVDDEEKYSNGKISQQQLQQLQVARLLNSQGVHLDVCHVIQTFPPSWPLHLLSSFITRSCRRTLHASHEGQITKMLSLAENWEVKERTWAVLREEGFLVEEEAEGGEETKEAEAADTILNEKIALSSLDPPSVDVFSDHKSE